MNFGRTRCDGNVVNTCKVKWHYVIPTHIVTSYFQFRLWHHECDPELGISGQENTSAFTIRAVGVTAIWCAQAKLESWIGNHREFSRYLEILATWIDRRRRSLGVIHFEYDRRLGIIDSSIAVDLIHSRVDNCNGTSTVGHDEIVCSWAVPHRALPHNRFFIGGCHLGKETGAYHRLWLFFFISNLSTTMVKFSSFGLSAARCLTCSLSSSSLALSVAMPSIWFCCVAVFSSSLRFALSSHVA